MRPTSEYPGVLVGGSNIEKVRHSIRSTTVRVPSSLPRSANNDTVALIHETKRLVSLLLETMRSHLKRFLLILDLCLVSGCIINAAPSVFHDKEPFDHMSSAVQ